VSRIICNSGPLIALGILGRLDILKSLFDEVLVPEAVQNEIERGAVKLSGLEDFRRAEWIRIVPLKEKRDELLESLLDIGEAAVIGLAREQKAALVLIDERKARKVARDVYGLQPIGTAHILVEAKRKHLLPDLASQFQKLRQEGYWIHDSIVQAALREAKEI
jgi:predicted nucleic acid-binding protein